MRDITTTMDKAQIGKRWLKKHQTSSHISYIIFSFQKIQYQLVVVHYLVDIFFSTYITSKIDLVNELGSRTNWINQVSTIN